MMQFRPHTWINTETLEPVHGIQAKKPGGKWLHVVSGRDFLLFGSPEARDREIEALRARVSNQ